MTKYFLMMSLVVCVGCTVGVACKFAPDAQASEQVIQTASPSPTPVITVATDNRRIYEDLRRQALGVKPKDLGITVSDKAVVVYGVVMDWDMPEGVATTIAFSTGDASMYNSAGGGVIGGVEHEKVRNAARILVKKADTVVAKAAPTMETPFPKKDGVRFYLLTNKGILYFEESMKNFENETSPWYSLFEEVNKVITELTIIDGIGQR